MDEPRYHHPFMDLHSIDIQEPESASSDNSSDLTPGFVSDKDDAVSGKEIGTQDDVAYLSAMLPVTMRRINEVRSQRAKRQTML